MIKRQHMKWIIFIFSKPFIDKNFDTNNRYCLLLFYEKLLKTKRDITVLLLIKRKWGIMIH